MVEVSGGDKLQRALAEIARKIGKCGELQVGFMENAVYPDGTQVAAVAAFQDFGAPRAGIPPRPFFRNMVAKNKDHWAGDLANWLKSTNYDLDRSFTALGDQMISELQQSIQDTNSPPLKPATIRAKGFDKPLIDTADLWRSASKRIK